MRTLQAQTMAHPNKAGRIPSRAGRWGIIGITILPLAFGLVCGAAQPNPANVALSWVRSPTPEVTGYRIYFGAVSRSYSNNITVGNLTNHTISGLTSGVTYYFTVTAYTANGVESLYSNELLYIVPGGLAQLQIRITANQQAIITVLGQVGHTYEIQAATDAKTWSVLGTVTTGTSGSGSYTNTNPGTFSKRFYRTRDPQP